jgi:hypothetical protein
MPHFFSMGKFFTVGVRSLLARLTSSVQMDDRLFRTTLSSEYCKVLTPRQMGKSSLIIRTVERSQQ